MASMLSRLRPHWPLIALLISASLLAGAHAFESVGGLAPCALCLKQRETHWIAATAASAWLGALKFAPKPDLEKFALFGICAAFLLCFGVAAYHVAVENHWVVAQCDVDLGAIRPLGEESHFDAPHCDVIAWSLFGISMAGYNAVLSGIAAMVSFALIRQPESKH